MVMVAVGSGHLVAGDAVTEVDLRRHAGITQELERPVDGGLADARVQLLDMLVELLQRVVAGEFKKGIGDDPPLGRGVQAFAAHEFKECQ